ncbi:hypothetical protein [Microbacterium sp. NPDC055665]
MTMDQLYMPITLVLIVAVVVRAHSAFQNAEAFPAWLATVIAIPALLSRGALIPIDTLDAWVGGQNIIFLIQCWCATFAFWAIGEAARLLPGNRDNDLGSRDPVKLDFRVPLLWSAGYTIPFFFIAERTPTELFFIDAHVDDLAAVLCGVLYMAGVIGICLTLLHRLRGRRTVGHWALKLGAAAVAGGSTLWSVAIVIHHALDLRRAAILWMYLGFDVLFYPGVVLMAVGLLLFAATRRVRQNGARSRARTPRQILERHSIDASHMATDPIDQLIELLVKVRDAYQRGMVTITKEEEVELREAADWVRDVLPQVVEFDRLLDEEHR